MSRRELTARQREVLAFERDWPVGATGKGAAIAEQLEISTSRYYQVLARLLDSAAAYEEDPLVIQRLRRRRRERLADTPTPRLVDGRPQPMRQ